jgi:hypothetical protein
MNKNQERELERALHSEEPSADPEVRELVDTAERVRSGFSVEAPQARHERAMFVSGAATRTRRSTWRTSLVPILATSAVLVGLAFLSLQAMPGDALFRVRQALDSVGLGGLPVDSVDRRLTTGEELVEEATKAFEDHRLEAATARATRAIQVLGSARDLLLSLGPEYEGNRGPRIEALSVEARNIIVAAAAAELERVEGRSGPNRGSDAHGNNSGPGSGGDGDDSSGPGSGGGSDDNSGSGSGSGDDSSGSGSGSTTDNSGSGSTTDNSGSGSTTDNSGSGSTTDNSGSDGGSGSNSGPGDGSGGGDGDSSGPGSG